VSGSNASNTVRVGADPSDVVVFRWVTGEETLLSDFGGPEGADDYALCLYDGTGAAAPLLVEAVARAGGTCLGRSCWKALGTKGFRYVNKPSTPDGLQKIVLTAGADGVARVLVKAKGSNLSFPKLPIDLPKTVQL
jgi:hypothetical protein